MQINSCMFYLVVVWCFHRLFWINCSEFVVVLLVTRGCVFLSPAVFILTANPAACLPSLYKTLFLQRLQIWTEDQWHSRNFLVIYPHGLRRFQVWDITVELHRLYHVHQSKKKSLSKHINSISFFPIEKSD